MNTRLGFAACCACWACMTAAVSPARAQFDFLRLVDTATPVPGQPGQTFSVFADPAIDGDTVVVRGRYQPTFPVDEGVYTFSLADGFIKIVDEDDALPGSGNLDFVSQGPRIGEGLTTFQAVDTSGFEGVFAAPVTGGPLTTLADENTDVPGTGGAEQFVNFGDPDASDGGRVLFVGEGSGGTDGLYAANANGDGALLIVADTTMTIPDSGGDIFAQFFTGNSPNHGHSATNVAFGGEGASIKGIYTTDLIAGGLTKIADTTDAFPGSGGGTYDDFGAPSVEGQKVYLFGINAGGDVATIQTDMAGSSPTVIAETGTPAPGTSDTFDIVIPTGLDGDNYVLVGVSGGTRLGLYSNLDGPLGKVIDTDDILDGKPIDSFFVSNDNLSGGVIPFSVEFDDGTKAVYVAIHQHEWRTNASGSWDDPANWTFGLRPRSVAPTVITPDHGTVVTGPEASAHVASLSIGAQSSGLAELAMPVGGHLRVDGALTVQPSGMLRVGGTISAGGGVDNDGIVAGSGQLDASMDTAIGAQVQVGNGDALTVTGAGNANAGTMSVIGGQLRFTQDLTNAASTGLIFAQNALLQFEAGLQNHGAVAASFGNSTIFGDVTNHPGASIVISGNSTMTFVEDVDNEGTIQVGNGSSAVYFGAVSGSGSFPGTGSHFFEGDLRPGASPAEIAFGGDVQFGAFSELQIELGGVVPGSEHDQVDVAGAANLDGTLSVELLAPFTPSPGDTFEVMTFGSRVGEFAQHPGTGLTGNVFLLPLYSESALQIYAALPGDVNLDGTVDGLDVNVVSANYLSGSDYRSGDANGDGVVNPLDLSLISANFGLTAPPPPAAGSGSFQAVPEPSTWLLFVTALIPMVASTRRCQRGPSWI